MLLGMLVYVVLYGKGYCVWGRGVSLQALRVRLASELPIQQVDHVCQPFLEASAKFDLPFDLSWSVCSDAL